MRWRSISLLVAALVALAWPAAGASGRILKVLPQFLDTQGRASLSPSLYERDAYQALLRLHPERRSGLRFNVQWKTKGPAWEPLTLRLELRGTATGDLPREIILDEKPATKGKWLTRWTGITLSPEEFTRLGTVTAWRASLWEGQTLLAQQQSFLW